MQTISKTILTASFLFWAIIPLQSQCISDECGDIFADWALLSEQVTICEGATFEVINQTTFPDIDFYVWDWGNGERDTVYEVSNYFYTYLFEEGTACSGNDFVVYNISLEIYRFCENGQSCHTQIAPVAIRFMPRVNFSLPPIACAGDTVSLSNFSCNGEDFFWDFGDGNTSTEENPGHVFDSSGVYDVTLFATNQCGTDSLSIPIEIIDKPIAQSSSNGSDNAIGCVPFTVTFDNFSQFADTFLWTFPDSAGMVFLDTFNTSSPSPVVEFTVPGIYTVTLDASNDCGSSEWVTIIEVLEPPIVMLDTLPSACETSTIELGDYLTTGGDIDNYSWSVTGPTPPNIPNEANPTVFFSNPGEFQIEVIVSNDYCPSASDNTVLFVQAPSGLSLEMPTLDPICDASDPVSPIASPGGGNWSGFGIDSSGLFNPALVDLGVYTLSYQLIDGVCLISDSISIEVLAGEPVATASNINDCETAAAIQLDSSPEGGSWSGEGISDPDLGLFDPSLTGAGLFQLTYSYVDSNNCIINSETTADIQAVPGLSLPDIAAFCTDVITLSLVDELAPMTSPEGGQLFWSGPFITDSLTGQFVSPGEGQYPVDLSYTLDLCTATTTTIISVINPDEALAGPDQSICNSESSISLQGFPAGGRWSGPGINNVFSGEVNIPEAGTGIHSYIYTIAGGSSCEMRDTMLLTVLGPDNLDAGTNVDFCRNNGMQNLPTPSPAGGTWSGPALLDSSLGLIDVDQLPEDSTLWYQYSISSGPTGCTFTDSVEVVVHPIPEVDFALPDYGCLDSLVTLGASPQAGINYHWLVGDHEPLSGDTINLNLAQAGTYEVQLTASSVAGCDNSSSQHLTISAVPAPGFALDNASGCGPLNVVFTDNSQGTDLAFNWDFGNGNSSTLANPPAAIYEAGIFDTTYVVQLQLSNNCGNTLAEDSVFVQARPVADFGTPVSNGCSPLEISFANVTTGNADSYVWDFGNGQMSTDSLPPNQVYSTPDSIVTNYVITLIATNLCGSDSTQQEILVQPTNVTPFFNADNTQGCQPLTVNFTNYASYGATISWDFGDGTTSGELDPTHTFTTPGYYTVYQHALTACSEDSVSINVEVLPAPDALFNHPPEVCPDEVIVFENLSDDFQTVFWDFGDGNSSTAINPEHHYQEAGDYEVTMVISSTAYGCQSLHQSDVTILNRPTATLSVDGISGCPPLEVCFTAETSNAPFYEWTFGDNNSSTALNPCNTYTATGLYTAQLRTANEQGCMSLVDTVSIRVFDQPTADFSIPESLYCGENQTITFSNTSIGATAYSWTFSNGLSSNLFEPEVNFNATGEYNVELTVNNTFNCQDNTTASFSILPQPLVDFAPILVDACAPQLVVFDNASLNANSFYWDFGNGENSNDPNPEITYNEAGSYDVTLTASYDELCFDSLQLSGSVDLLRRPIALFSWDSPSADYDGLVRFTNESMDAVSYLWDFGDGTFSEEASPLHDYEVNGNWEAELLAIAANGCTDTALVEVTPEFMYKVFFPNALSPESGEGDVRLFKPVGIGFESWTLEIFSPWGQRVFLADDLLEDQPAAAWDGSFNDEILPQGAYAYKATVAYLNGVKRIYTGSVTLIR